MQFVVTSNMIFYTSAQKINLINKKNSLKMLADDSYFIGKLLLYKAW